MSYRRAWDGHEWQRHALQLVQLRHGHQHVQAVPDQVGGDAGLEFICLDKEGGKGGVLYQCYAPEETADVAKAAIAQKSKARRYLNKLQTNKGKLGEILKGLKIDRWILLCPFLDNKEVVAAVRDRGIEIRDLKLPFLADNFEALLHCQDDFVTEIEMLRQQGAMPMKMPAQDPALDIAVEQDDIAQRVGRLRGIPTAPTAEFARAPELRLEILRDGEWILIDEAVRAAKARVAELEETPIEDTEAAVPEILERLEVVRTDIDRLSAQLEAIRSEANLEEQEQRALRIRLESLQQDLKRNEDALKLRRLGSDLGQAAGEHICPTCHQDVSSELLPAVEAIGMGLEENISFVKSQIELYKVGLDSANERVKDCYARFRARDDELREAQSELRSLRQAIMQPSKAPSRIVIEEIVRLQAFLERATSFEEAAIIASEELQAIAQVWSRLQEELKGTPPDNLTNNDSTKIYAVQGAIQRRIQAYGFRSFQPSEIILSLENQRPLALTRDEEGDVVEKEITFEVSASDGIRLKWAYYLSLLQLARNHAGLVVYDEPGQQEIDASSLYAFLKDGARDKSPGRQIIISTSEPLPAVKAAVGDEANVINFDGFILQPLR